ncbi:unnamed protein product [Closterium sp. Naga37s-1]|nr:unnamed protein product [Closterium sp. Naga37s-1]
MPGLYPAPVPLCICTGLSSLSNTSLTIFPTLLIHLSHAIYHAPPQCPNPIPMPQPHPPPPSTTPMPHPHAPPPCVFPPRPSLQTPSHQVHLPRLPISPPSPPPTVFLLHCPHPSHPSAPLPSSAYHSRSSPHLPPSASPSPGCPSTPSDPPFPSAPSPPSAPSISSPSYAYLGDFRALGEAFRHHNLHLSLSLLRVSSAPPPGEAGTHLPSSESHGERCIWWRAYLLVSNPVQGGALGGRHSAGCPGGGGSAVGRTGTLNDPAAGVNEDVSAGGVAFFVSFNVRRRVDGKRVLPAVYSENYLSLLPGEEVTVQVEFAHEPCSGCVEGISSSGSSCSSDTCHKEVIVEVSGWNVCTSSCDVPLLKP